MSQAKSSPVPTLRLPAGFRFPDMVALRAEGDTMHDGRDEHYLAVGLSALRCIDAALEGREPRRILDLPCGFGRVTRMLQARFPQAQITVSDLDRPAVDFAAATFNATGLYSVEDLAVLDLGGTFDLIWVGSLVTHLSEAQTRAFLQTMHRAMEPDATLVVSSHGPTVADGLKRWLYGLEPAAAAAVLDGYAACGYGHRGYGDSDGYGISLTDQPWWAAAAAQSGFTLVSYEEQAWDAHQDVVALRRAAAWPSPVQAAPDATVVAARKRVARYDPRLPAFDSAFYLAANPDVATAVAAGHFVSAYQHYATAGRAEGRAYSATQAGRTPVPTDGSFDEAWYLLAFPDVAKAVAEGGIASAYDHWLDMGHAEGRPPHG